MDLTRFNFNISSEKQIRGSFPSQVIVTGPANLIFDIHVLVGTEISKYESEEFELGLLTSLSENELTIFALRLNRGIKIKLAGLIVLSIMKEALEQLRLAVKMESFLKDLKPAFDKSNLYILDHKSEFYISIDSGIIKVYRSKSQLSESLKRLYVNQEIRISDYYCNQL
jgi:hypothetical protein